MSVNVNMQEIRLTSGNLIVKDDQGNDVDLGLMEDVKFSVEQETAVIRGDNGQTPPILRTKKATISATLKELNIDKLQLIAGGMKTEQDASSSPSGNARKILTVSDVFEVLTGRDVKFVSTDEEGKIWGITLFNAYASKGLDMSIGSDYEIDKVLTIGVEFSSEGPGAIFEIIDEQAV